MNYTLDDWWCHLTISEKERIAGKLFQEDTDYPNCTNHWLSLKDDQKQKIHDHVTDKHGHVMEFWDEGFSFSY